MTASAEAVYYDLYKKAKAAQKRGDYASSHCTVFNMLREAVRQMIPSDPLNKKYALSGHLSNIFRIKKGRYRICWIASSQLRRVCILYISESLRKEGDVNDPYKIFAQAVMSGQFNDIFAQFGVRMPQLKGQNPKAQ
jgi:mRNA-degrading endonuclease RelE of RelBE toxin-antitoxin system